METAGLMWQPETFPTEYAMATITSPKVSAVGTRGGRKGFLNRVCD